MTSWFKPLKTDSRKRSLMALLGGVAAIGIAKSVSAQTSAVPLGPSVGNGSGGGGGSSATVASLSALAALSPDHRRVGIADAIWTVRPIQLDDRDFFNAGNERSWDKANLSHGAALTISMFLYQASAPATTETLTCVIDLSMCLVRRRAARGRNCLGSK